MAQFSRHYASVVLVFSPKLPISPSSSNKENVNLIGISKIRSCLWSLSDPANVSPSGATHSEANLALITGPAHSLEFPKLIQVFQK